MGSVNPARAPRLIEVHSSRVDRRYFMLTLISEKKVRMAL